MVDIHIRSFSKTAYFLGLCGLALFANSCGRTHASVELAAPVESDGITKAIHDYGLGHNGSLSLTSSTKPTETEDVYSARITALLERQDFAQLEKIARENRSDNGRLIGGLWKNYTFYEGIEKASTTEEPNEGSYEQQISRAKKWISLYPDSTTARLSLAYLYLGYASHARGTGRANTVSDSQWDDFHSHSAQAKAILMEANALKEKDPAWYYAMQRIALHEGWDKTRTRALFEQASTFEPDYYHYYRQYANYLLPQWYGEPGDVQALAEEISSRIPEPHGSMLYFYITSTLACYCEEAMHDLPQVSYPKVKQGYENVARFYGISNLNANRFAFTASTFKDRASAREAFMAIDRMDTNIWYTEGIFNTAHEWANAQ